MIEAAALTAPQRTWHGRLQRFSPPGATAESDIRMMMEMGRELLVNVPIRQLFTEAFDAPVWVDNDANVAALGEWRFGAGQGIADLLYVTVSTGVGGGWILDGRPYRGATGVAGEIGHMVVDPDGPLCLCGKRGCVERLASGPYMARDVALAFGMPLYDVSGKLVAELAAEGVETAVAILERGAKSLGIGLGNAANLLNPSRIVLGGGITKSGKRWWQLVRQTAQETALPEVQFDIVPAQLGDDAPLWGAVALTQL